MKIAIDCRYIGDSGIGTFLENTLEYLIRDNHQMGFLLLCKKNSGFVSNGNVVVMETEINPFSLKEFLLFPVKEINKCDAFFTPYISIPRGIVIPIYSTIHDMVFFDVEGIISPFGAFIRKLFYLRTVRKSAKIFTVSEFTKERILYHISTSKEIIVTGNGVSEYIRKHHPSKMVEKDYFVYVGNIKKNKGLYTLIQAYSAACYHGLKTKLMIVGNMEKFRSVDASLSELIQKSGNRIEFSGWIDNDRLIQIISEAKALIQPSLYEGFGIPPLEALYLGTNVIISDIPVFKEIYKDLPVTYFKVGDFTDLSNKLLAFKGTTLPNNIKDMIDGLFNYRNIANVIIQTITQNEKL